MLGALAPRLGKHTSPGLLEGALLGVAGAVLGGLVGWYAIHNRFVGFALAAVVAVGLAYLVRPAGSPR